MTEPPSTAAIMRDVSLALVPGLLIQATVFGPRLFLHMLAATTAALLAEAACLRLRGLSWPDLARPLADGSALVTALLLAASVPPAASPWISGVAATLAITIGKQAFGGLGQNPFNPAMAGYAIVLVSFPAAFSLWPAGPDGLTGATLLDVLKHDDGRTLSEFAGNPAFGAFGASGFESASVGYLFGGLWLAWRGHIAWRIPAGLLLATATITVLLYDGGGSASLDSPLRQWFAGGLMLAAFFIATDPVTHPRSTRAQWLFAAIAGTTIMVIRAAGSYPDGLAFAILLANAFTPWLDRRYP